MGNAEKLTANSPEKCQFSRKEVGIFKSKVEILTNTEKDLYNQNDKELIYWRLVWIYPY